MWADGFFVGLGDILTEMLIIKNDEIQMVRTEKQDISFVREAEREEENAKYVGQWPYERHAAALTDTNILHALMEICWICDFTGLNQSE